jgi:hypothetical protein
LDPIDTGCTHIVYTTDGSSPFTEGNPSVHTYTQPIIVHKTTQISTGCLLNNSRHGVVSTYRYVLNNSRPATTAALPP